MFLCNRQDRRGMDSIYKIICYLKDIGQIPLNCVDASLRVEHRGAFKPYLPLLL